MIIEAYRLWILLVGIYVFVHHFGIENPETYQIYLFRLQVGKSFWFTEWVWGLGWRIIERMIHVAKPICTHSFL